MKLAEYNKIKKDVIDKGYIKDIQWAQNIKPPTAAAEFCIEYIHVVINSGMKNQIANEIFKRVIQAIHQGVDIARVFNHTGKVNAIKSVWIKRHKIWEEYQKTDLKLSYLQTLPYIGNITKYHLARNLGTDCCKPDRHLMRIAAKYHSTPEELCGELSEKSGDRIGVVDVVLWRAGNLKLI
ncbi:MAG: hypothetical protein KAU20_02415 [Nanoarchaeota archaeon]|nr:hypothetical protein [Nanoarchaeota archaeon]